MGVVIARRGSQPWFGRRRWPDARDAGYPMRRLLPDVRALALPARKTWRCHATNLDQGPTGTCVGHAWRNFLRTEPIRTERTGRSAVAIYRAAVKLDPWKENDREADLPVTELHFGTSVRAGAQAVQGFGHLRSYVWAWELQTVVEWVLQRGPVVLGTDWYSSLSVPTKEGIARITPGASYEGGHAYLLRGIDTRRALARCSNSWGDDWGVWGDFWLPLSDLERLIRQYGEACAAVQQRVTAQRAATP